MLKASGSILLFILGAAFAFSVGMAFGNHAPLVVALLSIVVGVGMVWILSVYCKE